MEFNLIYFLVVLLLAITNAFTLYFLVKTSKIIFKIEDSLAECLDQLDLQYREIFKVLKIPVLVDDPQIKRVVVAIKNSHTAILKVSNILTKEWNQDEKED